MGSLVTRTALLAIAAALVFAAPAPADAPAFTVGDSIAPSTASPGGSATITVTATNTGTDQATMYFILDLGPGAWSLGSASQTLRAAVLVQHDAVRHDVQHRHLARRHVGELQRSRDGQRNGNSGHHPQLTRLRVPGNGVRHSSRKLCAVARRRIGAPSRWWWRWRWRWRWREPRATGDCDAGRNAWGSGQRFDHEHARRDRLRDNVQPRLPAGNKRHVDGGGRDRIGVRRLGRRMRLRRDDFHLHRHVDRRRAGLGVLRRSAATAASGRRARLDTAGADDPARSLHRRAAARPRLHARRRIRGCHLDRPL